MLALLGLGLAASLGLAPSPDALADRLADTLAPTLLAIPNEDDGHPRFQPPELEPGWDMQETWDDVWRRFQDRHGRPDPQGPLLQPSPELQRPEYELTLAQAEHPLPLEADWNTRQRGARVYINSDDEFSFFNRVRIKERVPMGRVGAFALRYDRADLREIRSSMVRLSFAFPDIRGTGAFVEIRPIARFEKPDLDAELIVGWSRPQIARVAARAFFFDPANNASDALAQNRDSPQEIRVLQRDGPHVGLSTELDLALIPRVRTQLFFGGVVPMHSSISFADETLTAYERTQSALLGGGWLEYAFARAPVRIGAHALVVKTSEVDSRTGDLAVLKLIPEREIRGRVYALASVGEGTRGFTSFELSGSYRRDMLPGHTSKYGSVTDDRTLLGLLRATWMPTRVFGLELGYLLLDRKAEGEGELAPFLTSTDHRLSTRFALAFNPYVRITFGVGWDLDDRSNRYDQGGMTLSMRW
ncbi:MAG: hypothetical protein KC431_28295 [Myxococcales bacterium]|nr:hypothetical protein [Myxococcales bacterium]